MNNQGDNSDEDEEELFTRIRKYFGGKKKRKTLRKNKKIYKRKNTRRYKRCN